MKHSHHIYNFSKSMYYGLIELIYYSFIWIPLAFYSFSFSGTILWLVLLLLSYSSYSILLFNKKASYWNVLLIAVINSGISSVIMYFQLQQHYNVFVYIISCLLILLFTICGFRQSALKFSESFTITFMGLSILGHLLLQIIKVTWLIELTQINSLLYICGVLSIILTLFITNERMLADQHKLLGKSSAQKHALLMNRLIISIFSFVIIAIIAFKEWQQAVEKLIKDIISWFLSLFKPGTEDKIIEQQLTQAMPELPFGAEEPKPPSDFLLFLEKLIVIIAYILLVFVIVGIIVLFAKLITRLTKRLLLFLRSNRAINETENVTYIDEVEEIEKTTRGFRRPLRFHFTKAKTWKTMSVEERCHHIYILFIRLAQSQGHQYIKPFTIKEQISYINSHYRLDFTSDELIMLERLYNKAKYGQAAFALSQTEIEQLNALYAKLNIKK